MKSRVLGSIGFLVGMVVGVGGVAHGVDLAEMQQKALADRGLIQQYQMQLEQRQQDVRGAEGAYYPSVDVMYTANMLDEASVSESRNNSVFRGSVTCNVFSGFEDKYNLVSAKMLRMVEKYRLQGIQQDLQLDVAIAYLQVFERLANKKVADSVFETLTRVYRDAENRYQVGVIGKNELLTFRVDYDNADITRKKAEGDLRKSINQLSRQVGSPVAFDSLSFSDFEQIPVLIDRDAYLEKMLANRSEIRVLESSIRSSEAVVKAREAAYYPRVDATGSYSHYDDEILAGSGDLNEGEWRAQMVMSMNLFQGHRTESSVAAAKLGTRELQYKLDELRQTLITTLDDLYIDFEVSLENIKVANRSIEQAEENLRITQLKYDEGLQRESDLLDAITNLSRAKYNHVSVLRTAFLNNFQLTRMIDGF